VAAQVVAAQAKAVAVLVAVLQGKELQVLQEEVTTQAEVAVAQ
jgi:hypothetical protein